MLSYNTIIYFTELYKQKPNNTICRTYLVCSNIICEPWKVFQPGPHKFCFDEDLHVDVLPAAESSLALFRPLVVLFDNRNALISMTITCGL